MSKKRLLIIYHIRNPHQTPLHSYRHIHVLDGMHELYEIDYFNAAMVWKDLKQPFLNLPQCPEKYRRGEYDCIVLHYTFLIVRCIGDRSELMMAPFEWLSEKNCLKVAIPQDEGNHSAILDDWFLRWGVHVIFSVHYHPDGRLYRAARHFSKIVPCLPGYVNKEILKEHLSRVKKIADRSLDIVYRGRPFNLRYGRASFIKSKIAESLAQAAKVRGLRTDISVQQEDRIYGDKWFDFISSSKAVFGVYGGYSAVDMRGEIKEQVEYFTSTKGVETLDDLNEWMPRGWDSHELFTVTPRHFESIACRTAQILTKHHYKGVLEANVHYIPLELDCSNMEEVLEQIQDTKRLQEMVDRSFEEIYQTGKYDYERLAELISNVIEAGRTEFQRGEDLNESDKDQYIEQLQRDKEAELTRTRYVYLQLQEEYLQNKRTLDNLAGRDQRGSGGIGTKLKRTYRKIRKLGNMSYYYLRRFLAKAFKRIVKRESQ